MAQMTNFMEDLALNFALRGQAITKQTLEISFHSSSPGETGDTGNELNLFASRLQPTFADSTARVAINNNTVSGNSLVAGTATYWGIHYGVGGSMLCYQENQDTPGGSATPLSIVISQEVEVAAAAIELSFPSLGFFTDAVVNDLLTQLFGAGSGTARTASHIGLHTTGGAEFTAGSYARGPSDWDAPTAGANNRQQCLNTSAVSFTNLQASDSPIAIWGAHTALTGGELVATVDQTDQNISNGDGANAGAGTLALLMG